MYARYRSAEFNRARCSLRKMVEAIKQSQEESGGISDASIDSDAKRATTVLRPGPTPEQIIKASADLQAMLSKHVNDNVRLRTA